MSIKIIIASYLYGSNASYADPADKTVRHHFKIVDCFLLFLDALVERHEYLQAQRFIVENITAQIILFNEWHHNLINFNIKRSTVLSIVNSFMLFLIGLSTNSILWVHPDHCGICHWTTSPHAHSLCSTYHQDLEAFEVRLLWLWSMFLRFCGIYSVFEGLNNVVSDSRYASKGFQNG